MENNKYEKMLVWFNNIQKSERYVIHINPDGSCVGINQAHEEEYEINFWRLK